MKVKENMLIVLVFVMAVFFHAACGGGDASYSPDPTIGDVPGVGDEPGGGGGDDEVAVGDDGEQEERDCFLDGFCYRECDTAAACPTGFSCIMNVCTFDCQTDDECGTGGICNSVGLCEASEGGGLPACSVDADCGDGRFCNGAGDCEQIPVLLGCQNDADCPMGQYCDDVHKCELFPGPGVQCGTDEDCPGDYYCDALDECQQDCRADDQCLDGEACDGTGRCVVPGVPASLAWFNFGGAGAESDPAGPVSFGSVNFKLKNVVMTPAGRNQVLSSTSYRLTGSLNY